MNFNLREYVSHKNCNVEWGLLKLVPNLSIQSKSLKEMGGVVQDFYYLYNSTVQIQNNITYIGPEQQ